MAAHQIKFESISTAERPYREWHNAAHSQHCQEGNRHRNVRVHTPEWRELRMEWRYSVGSPDLSRGDSSVGIRSTRAGIWRCLSSSDREAAVR